MRLLRVFVDIKKMTVWVALAGILAAPLPGYSQDARIDYSQPKPAFPSLLAPYTAREVPPPSFINTPRINQLLRDGKLYLSLSDAIALVLENNLDLAIARYNLSIADTDILLAKSGSQIRGVATGLVQGTLGGGVGGFGTGASGAGAGGTTGGAGGAGSGSSGLVQSTLGTGAAIQSFDPTLSGTTELEDATFPLSNTRTTGVNSLTQKTFTSNFNYNQGFPTGTGLTVGFNNSRQLSNNLFNSLNPQLNSSLRATVSQRLLQGFGLQTNRRFIRIAENNRRISDSSFRAQIIATVTQIQNIYWDLVTAYEDVKVKARSLSLAQKTISDNRKQVEIGTLAPIEIVRANSDAAARNQDLIISQTQLQLQQTLIKNALSRNLTEPGLAAAQVIPTDTMSIPAQEAPVSIDDLIRLALAQSTDIEQSQIDLVNRDISKKAARNALLPSVDAFAFYGGASLAGDQNSSTTCGNPGAPAPPSCVPAGTLGGSGFGTALGHLFNNSGPDKGAGVTLNIPLRNRAAQANQVRSELEYRQAQLRLQQLQNTINIQVRNAQFSLEQNRARVEAARQGQELGRQSLDAESKKYALGASTNFLVLQAQRDLAIAESNEVTAMSAYEKSRVEVDRVTGQTLVRNGIQIADAVSGTVTANPVVPGVVPGTVESAPNSIMDAPPNPPVPPKGAFNLRVPGARPSDAEVLNPVLAARLQDLKSAQLESTQSASLKLDAKLEGIRASVGTQAKASAAPSGGNQGLLLGLIQLFDPLEDIGRHAFSNPRIF